MFRFDEDTGEVEVVKEAMSIPEMHDLWLNDKLGDKSFFKKATTYIYHMYCRDHSLSNLPFAERKDYVVKSYFGGRLPRSFTNNKRMDALKDVYLLLQMGIEERLAITIREAIAIQKERIAALEVINQELVEIPYSLKHDFDIYRLENAEKGIYVKIPPVELSGVVKKRIDVYNTDIFIKEIEKAFKLSKQYDEALRRAAIEKEELKVKYDGLSLLERYHNMNKNHQKLYLKEK